MNAEDSEYCMKDIDPTPLHRVEVTQETRTPDDQ